MNTRSTGRLLAAAILLAGMPVAMAAAPCPPLLSCLPKPVLVWDPEKADLDLRSLKVGRDTLERLRIGQSLTQSLQRSTGPGGGATAARAGELAAPPARFADLQAASDAGLFRNDPADPRSLAAMTGARRDLRRAAAIDGLAQALSMRTLLLKAGTGEQAAREARAGATSLRHDLAANQRARLATIERFDQLGLLLAQLLASASSEAIVHASPARDTSPGDRAPESRTPAAAASATPIAERLLQLRRQSDLDTAWVNAEQLALSRVAARRDDALQRTSQAAAALGPQQSSPATPQLDAGLQAIYRAPSEARQSLLAGLGNEPAAQPWSTYAAHILNGELVPQQDLMAGDLSARWDDSVLAADSVLATWIGNPAGGGPLRTSVTEARRLLANLRDGDARIELARLALEHRLTATWLELRDWTSDAQLLSGQNP